MYPQFSVQKASTQAYPLARNKSESAIKYYSTHGGMVQDRDEDDDIHGGGTDTNMASGTGNANGNDANASELGYASDVCDYNVVGPGQKAQQQAPPSSGKRGFLPLPVEQQPSTRQQQLDNSYMIQQQNRPTAMVSPYLKPKSPSLESSLYDRRQRLIQKRAKIFQSTDNLIQQNQQNPPPTTLSILRSITPNHLNSSGYHAVPNLTVHNNINSKSHDHLPNLVHASSVKSIASAFNNASSYNNLYQAPPCYNNDIPSTATTSLKSTPHKSSHPHANLLFQAGPSSNSLGQDSSFSRKISQESTTTADEDNVAGSKSGRKNAKPTGVRAKIARRKRMRDANSMDVVHGSLSDQEATSEPNDEDDSVEEKQDNEPIHDWQSTKMKSPILPNFSTNASNSGIAVNVQNQPAGPSVLESTDVMMTPETARKNWNLRFANIKNSFNAASEEDLLSKSRSPSVPKNQQDSGSEETQLRGRSKNRDLPILAPTQSQSLPPQPTAMVARRTPIERPQSKEDKNKQNSLAAAANMATSPSPIRHSIPPQKKLSAPEPTSSSSLPKSKQPTPNRDGTVTAAVRATKSMPRENYDDRSRAEVLGLVQASKEPTGSKGGDMDYQEYMSIINKVRKTKEQSMVRAEHYRLASMYAKEKQRKEDLIKEEERLKQERFKIENEQRNNPNPTVIPLFQPRPQPQTLLQQPQQTMMAPGGTASSSLTGSNQSLPEEKGQIDKKEQEQVKLSPSPKHVQQPSPPVEIVPSRSEPEVAVPTMPDPVIQQRASPVKPVPRQGTPPPPMEAKLSLRTPENQLEQIKSFEEMQKEQELRESQVKEEQEKLQKLREEQLRQEKDREEIRKLEFQRLQQIQEEQRHLEEERRRQEEQIRLEQLHIEEERRRQEKLQAEKNAEYNKQRLEMEARNVALNEGQRVLFDPKTDNMSTQEKVLQERLQQQERLRQEHRQEESKIRQEKLKLIQQEEMLISRQEDMLHQIEAERLNLAKQEQLIRKRQQERLHQVRQEKQLLEKQEEMIRIREDQLQQERERQLQLREEQKALKEQEEAIRKRQEQISKELMTASNIIESGGDLLSSDMFLDKDSSSSSTNEPAPTVKFQQSPQIHDIVEPVINVEAGIMEGEDGEEELLDDEEYSGSGSGSDTLDEDAGYECKVEVKQQTTLVPKTVRTIETTINNLPWEPVTPYLTYSEKQNVQAQEEISAIFSESKSFTKPGVVTSPESMRTSTNLITTPDSLSLQSQMSLEPRSLSSSCTNPSPPPIPPLPVDSAISNNGQNEMNTTPNVPTRRDSLNLNLSPQPFSLATSGATATSSSGAAANFLEVPQVYGNNKSGGSSPNSPPSPRIGGPGSAFKPYASNENLFDPNNFASKQKSGNESSAAESVRQNYPLHNGSMLDSRYFMKDGREMRPPMHGKVRELKKPARPPFSTTDTEPDMKECNLPSVDNNRRRGKQKIATYSTSETEEEYQAYLRSKPKWHGKGGHKDSWDPMQIQSPPQITQKPVGIIQKPKAQSAQVQQPPQAIERGLQIGPTPIYVPPQQPPMGNYQLQSSLQPQQQALGNGHANVIRKSDSIIEVRPVAQSTNNNGMKRSPQPPSKSNAHNRTSVPDHLLLKPQIIDMKPPVMLEETQPIPDPANPDMTRAEVSEESPTKSALAKTEVPIVKSLPPEPQPLTLPQHQTAKQVRYFLVNGFLLMLKCIFRLHLPCLQHWIKPRILSHNQLLSLIDVHNS